MMKEEEIRRIAEAAGEAGARRALAACGLNDGDAGKDIGDLRNLLSVWRGTKRTAGQTVVRIMTTILLFALLTGAAMKLKWIEFRIFG